MSSLFPKQITGIPDPWIQPKTKQTRWTEFPKSLVQLQWPPALKGQYTQIEYRDELDHHIQQEKDQEAGYTTKDRVGDRDRQDPETSMLHFC